MCSHLTGFGRNWDLYTESCCYSYNSHVIPSINQSPYYLVYLREAPSLCDLQYTPLVEVKYTYKDYVDFLRSRLENVAKFMLKTQAVLQHAQAAKQLEKVKQPVKYKVNLIVFVLCPGSSHLNTKSLKFNANYVGPLYIAELLGSDKALLKDMEN